MAPRIVTDIVDVYVFRRWLVEADHMAGSHVEFLQLYRTGAPVPQTWQPVMGHVEPGETAVECAYRELEEELGLHRHDPALMGVWALEQVHPFFIAPTDTIVMSPRFAAEVDPAWRFRLNGEHTDGRWIAAHQAHRYFMWPGQLAACREITASLLKPGSLTIDALRLHPLEPPRRVSPPALGR